MRRFGSSKLACLPWLLGAWTVVSSLACGQDQSLNELVKRRLEEKYQLSAVDAVRWHLLGKFGTVEQFAKAANIETEDLLAWLQNHQWELPLAPARSLQNRPLDHLATVRSSLGESISLQLIDRAEIVATPETTVRISSDRSILKLRFDCDEPEMGQVLARYATRNYGSDELRQLWTGDLVPLKARAAQKPDLMASWKTTLESAPPRSIWLDDCVVVMLTPLAAGQEPAHLWQAAFVQKPGDWLKEHPIEKARQIWMTGTCYLIAVNAAGEYQSLFYDPWNGGVIYPAWPVVMQANCQREDSRWIAELSVAWDSLLPRIHRDAIWGVDTMRIRRARLPQPVVTRSPRTTGVRYDLDSTALPERALPIPPSIELKPMAADVPTQFPSEDDWKSSSKSLTFSDMQSGDPVAEVSAQMMFDTKRLYVRFHETAMPPRSWRVVSRQEEIQESPKASRLWNYLDRREHYGLDWGDYVEVLLLPDIERFDRFHGGICSLLVNAEGTILERRYDRFGCFSVEPEYSPWRSNAQVRVQSINGAKILDIAIPFNSLSETGTLASRMGLNLHRAISSNGPKKEIHATWSRPPAGYAAPGWPMSLSALRDPRHVGTLHLDLQKPIATTVEPGQFASAPGRLRAADVVSRDVTSDRMRAIQFVDSNTGWAIGGMGTVLKSSDGGKSWSMQNTGTDFILEDLHFVDDRHGWIVGGWPRDSQLAIHGGMGVILATNDGGQTWQKQIEGQATWLDDVFFLSPQLGWAVGEYGVVMKTTDGGKLWRQIRQVDTGAWLYGVTFRDELNGVAVGHDETILRTTDGGESWKQIDAPQPLRNNRWPTAFRDVAFDDFMKVWIVGDAGTILKSTDGGLTWGQVPHSLSHETVSLLSFETIQVSRTGIVRAVSPAGVLQWNPGNAVPTPMKLSNPGWWRGIWFVDDQTGWLCGERGTLAQTKDGGASWQIQRESPRPVGVMYISAHDHHLNNYSLASLAETADVACVCFGRGLRPFELGGDYNPRMVTAAAMADAASFVHSFNDFQWRERDRPDGFVQRAQNFDGLSGAEQRIVAAIRAAKPRVLFVEQPETSEDYYAHGVGDIARSAIRAFDLAGDPRYLPDLVELGLQPHTPERLYIVTNWATELYQLQPQTHRTIAVSPEAISKRLGRPFGEAKARSRNCFWGLLDRGSPPVATSATPSWPLYLKSQRGDNMLPGETDWRLPGWLPGRGK